MKQNFLATPCSLIPLLPPFGIGMELGFNVPFI